MQSTASELPGPAHEESLAGKDRLAGLLLGLALVLGALRFVRLGEWSLWYDEAATWFDLHTTLDSSEIHNPFGYRLIGWTVALFGGVPTEARLRLLPAVCGWLVIPVAYFVFRPFAGRRRAAAAALLLATSSWHVYWSQNARFYTFAQLVSLCGSGLVLRGLWNGRVVQALCGFALAGSAALLHASAALVVPALALAPWILKPLGLADLARARKATWVLFAVGLVVLAFKWSWVFATWETYSRQAPAFSPGHYLLTTGFYITPVVATAALFGCVLSWTRRSSFGLFACVVAAVVLLGVLLVSLYVRISAQYVFVLLPWVAILAVWPLAPAATSTTPRAKALELGWLALLVLPQLANCALYFTVRKGERPQWREAYEFVWNRREKDDLVLGMEASVGEFYLDPLKHDLRNAERVAWLDKWRAHEPREWAEHARRAWFVFNPEQLYGWEPEDKADFERFLREQCRLVKCFPLYVESRDLSVWVYVRG